jgi:hypothetical protein
MASAPGLTVVLTALILGAVPAEGATMQWNWSYSGAGISASGAFTTDATADADGNYLITGITGQRNGVDIVGLTPTGTANPGNDPYVVDNLVGKTGVQLTLRGFGFALSNGYDSNPFNNLGYYEYLSVPPFTPGAGPDTPITFMAAPVP